MHLQMPCPSQFDGLAQTRQPSWIVVDLPTTILPRATTRRLPAMWGRLVRPEPTGKRCEVAGYRLRPSAALSPVSPTADA
ncbi:MAG: hypothetical protein M0Z82_05560 [Actinomycetota bacterium]|nr:hypothetical protein [Actinomycetota bacterium]